VLCSCTLEKFFQVGKGNSTRVKLTSSEAYDENWVSFLKKFFRRAEEHWTGPFDSDALACLIEVLVYYRNGGGRLAGERDTPPFGVYFGAQKGPGVYRGEKMSKFGSFKSREPGGGDPKGNCNVQKWYQKRVL